MSDHWNALARLLGAPGAGTSKSAPKPEPAPEKPASPPAAQEPPAAEPAQVHLDRWAGDPAPSDPDAWGSNAEADATPGSGWSADPAAAAESTDLSTPVASDEKAKNWDSLAELLNIRPAEPTSLPTWFTEEPPAAKSRPEPKADKHPKKQPPRKRSTGFADGLGIAGDEPESESEMDQVEEVLDINWSQVPDDEPAEVEPPRAVEPRVPEARTSESRGNERRGREGRGRDRDRDRNDAEPRGDRGPRNRGRHEESRGGEPREESRRGGRHQEPRESRLEPRESRPPQETRRGGRGPIDEPLDDERLVPGWEAAEFGAPVPDNDWLDEDELVSRSSARGGFTEVDDEDDFPVVDAGAEPGVGPNSEGREDGGRGRRRRRRRRRGGGGGGQASQPAAELNDLDPVEALPDVHDVDDPWQEVTDDEIAARAPTPSRNDPPRVTFDDDHEDAEEVVALRRGRRRRRLRDEPEVEDAPAARAPAPPPASGGSRRSRHRDDEPRRREPEPPRAPPEDVIDTEDHEPMSQHRNIPTWLDAVDILISTNMESRRREPSRRGGGGRGGNQHGGGQGGRGNDRPRR